MSWFDDPDDTRELSKPREIFIALKALYKQGEQLMSAVSDWAAKEATTDAQISAALDVLTTGIAALDTIIQNFQNSPGTLSPADQAFLDAAAATSAALAAKAQGISTTPPGATIPPVVVTPPAPPARH
jgi:hypothetical protein